MNVEHICPLCGQHNQLHMVLEAKEDAISVVSITPSSCISCDADFFAFVEYTICVDTIEPEV